MLKQRGYEVACYDESIQTPDYEAVDSEYILLSSMSATVNRAYKLADFFRKKGRMVYMGGLHVSFHPEEALQHCDAVVVGEGEQVLFDLIKDKPRQRIIRGTTIDDLNAIPMPDYRLVYGMRRNPRILSVCTSRGCPYSCRFCTLKIMFGTQYRTVATKTIIDYLLQFTDLRTLCFDEPNFTVDKGRAVEILTQMKEQGVHPRYAWPSVSIDAAQDDALLKLCGEVAQFHFSIGIESINQQVLDAFNKKQTPATIKKGLRKLHDYGIKVHGFFIFGSDFDDKTVFQKTVDFCQETEIDFPSFSALTPYVGTEVRQDLENADRIFTNNWDYYDGAHVVFHPRNMTALELQEGVISAFEDFYSTGKAFHHLARGELFYGVETLYVRHLFKKIIQENEEYLEYLQTIAK
jgi:radical SAM superfamily enzyme YgiQ (UPF0313 family)